MYNLPFISQEDFENHVRDTIRTYNETLQRIDLKKFNQNVIDPIKLLFDKSVYQQSFDDVIKAEIQRQRDKSNTNSIGYFHQNMFKYIARCEVPESGWDVLVNDDPKYHKIFVEMKNKHNTMNSASSQKTYMKMQNQILRTPENYCFLVEVIAPRSRNNVWKCCVDGTHVEHEHIRRVSIDQFYKIVTRINNAFYMVCQQLPETIEKLVSQDQTLRVQHDTVIDELRAGGTDMQTQLYLLAFETYEGFQNEKIK